MCVGNPSQGREKEGTRCPPLDVEKDALLRRMGGRAHGRRGEFPFTPGNGRPRLGRKKEGGDVRGKRKGMVVPLGKRKGRGDGIPSRRKWEGVSFSKKRGPDRFKGEEEKPSYERKKGTNRKGGTHNGVQEKKKSSNTTGEKEREQPGTKMPRQKKKRPFVEWEKRGQ